MQPAACRPNNAGRWTLGATGTLTSVGDPNWCVDMTSAQSGTAAVLQRCAPAQPSQRFVVRPVSQRYVIVNAGLGQALEVSGGTLTAGTAVRNNTWLNGSTQAFTYDASQTLPDMRCSLVFGSPDGPNTVGYQSGSYLVNDFGLGPQQVAFRANPAGVNIATAFDTVERQGLFAWTAQGFVFAAQLATSS